MNFLSQHNMKLFVYIFLVEFHTNAMKRVAEHAVVLIIQTKSRLIWEVQD